MSLEHLLTCQESCTIWTFRPSCTSSRFRPICFCTYRCGYSGCSVCRITGPSVFCSPCLVYTLLFPRVGHSLKAMLVDLHCLPRSVLTMSHTRLSAHHYKMEGDVASNTWKALGAPSHLPPCPMLGVCIACLQF